MRDKKVYLLLKTHNQTGLKYLCRHITSYEKTCYNYKGSGVYWKRHIAKYGDDVSTEIVAICESIEEAKIIGLTLSEKWDIVNNKDFANLVPENGQGGSDPAKCRKKNGNRFGYDREPNRYIGNDNPAKNPEVRKKISDKLRGRIFTEAHKKKLSDARKGIESPLKGKPNPHAKTNHMNSISPIKCTYCDKQSTIAVMKKFHFEKCKYKNR